MKRMAKLTLGLAVVSTLTVVTCSGCAKTRGALAGADGGTASAADAGAAAPAYAGPFEAHVVARTLAWRTRLVPRANGTTVLDAGIFRYNLTADGRAERIGDDASYVKQMPADDNHLAGYEVEPVGGDFSTVEGAYVWPDLRGAERHPMGGKVDDELDLPSGIHGGELRRAADGTGIVIADDPDGGLPVTVVASPRSKTGTLLRIAELDVAHAKSTRCEHVPSWQRPHLLCNSRVDDLTSVHRLVGDRWERVRIADELARGLRTGAVAHDGTLWLGVGGNVVRIATSGAVETLMLPPPDAKLARAYYSSSEAYGRPQAVAQIDEGSADGARRFERIFVAPAVPPTPSSRIHQIVPRKDGEAWVLAADGSASILVHLSRPAMAPVPDALTIGTETDQRNELRNTRPPIVWVGHCAQLFIALAKQRADGSLASETVWSREPMIAAAMKKSLGKTTARTAIPDAALVEGRLGGRRVAGVLVWRSSPAVSEELLEKSATALAAELSSSTGLPPDITCTAPVLERASKL